MKILIFTFFLSILIYNGFTQSVPNIQIKNLNHEIVNTQDLFDGESLVILSFWATWCKPCIKELEAYNENIIDWNDQTGVKLIAVSVDNIRSMNRVAPFVHGRAWSNIKFYLDPNEDFKRAMNVINVPHTFLLDGNANILWQHTSYSEGDEYELYEAIIQQSSK
ncbi:MAG: TlpA disulfide reductase family protein [Bacteroidales bacterium]|jgi:cytochrome c biogenesis protein CcmG/thiol:disulfide interchange protein DsbE|nr:TlpA disulfide reductase family protein [Bacteroidales bacterium]